MTDTPLVSVIVPTYNRPDFLVRTMRSILDQTYDNIELVVISNCRSDENRKAADSLNDPRVYYADQDNSGGPSAPRNHGIRLAKGEYIAVCDDDDIWLPTKLEKQIEALQNNPDCGLCYTHMIFFDETGDEWSDERSLTDFDALRYKNVVPISSVVIRAELIEKHGGFEESKLVGISEDYEFILRHSYYTKFLFIDEKLVRYWNGEGRATSTNDNRTIKDNWSHFIDVMGCHYLFLKKTKANPLLFILPCFYFIGISIKSSLYLIRKRLKDKNMTAAQALQNPEDKDRFGFGDNWNTFLTVLDDTRIAESQSSLQEMLEMTSLDGKTFLDVGSGSGLSSLVARKMGAKVYSLDYDTQSVGCTQELKNKYFPQDTKDQWHVEQGSALDADYIKSLGQFDIVYSWGVLHHTGDMHNALENVVPAVAPGGLLFISIYNDQGSISKLNTLMKKTYNNVPGIIQKLMAVAYLVLFAVKGFIKDCLFLRNPLARYKNKVKERGMSVWYDVVDWVGGYPFEVATPDEIFEFYKKRGFKLVKLKTVGRGHGCNEYIFQKEN